MREKRLAFISFAGRTFSCRINTAPVGLYNGALHSSLRQKSVDNFFSFLQHKT